MGVVGQKLSAVSMMPLRVRQPLKWLILVHMTVLWHTRPQVDCASNVFEVYSLHQIWQKTCIRLRESLKVIKLYLRLALRSLMLWPFAISTEFCPRKVFNRNGEHKGVVY